MQNDADYGIERNRHVDPDARETGQIFSAAPAVALPEDCLALSPEQISANAEANGFFCEALVASDSVSSQSLPCEFFAQDSDEIESSEFPSNSLESEISSVHATKAETSEEFANDDAGKERTKHTVSEYVAARMVEEKHRFLVWLGRLYIWKEPAYQLLPENELLAMLKESFDEDITKQKTIAFWRGVIAQLESNSNNFVDLSTIHRPTEEVVFRNGVYNVYTQAMRPASPDDNIMTFNDVVFNAESTSDGRIVEQFFQDFSGGDPEIRELAWSIIGAILSSENSFKKYFLFYGASDTGKSVLGNVIETLVGERNCSHFPLNRLGGFETAQLVGKKLNCNLDLSAVELSDLGVFKMLTGGGLDTIDCQKKYGRFVTLHTNEIKMLFGTNALPKVSEEEDPTSFFGRMILLPFLNSVPTERKNLHLISDLMAEKDYIIKKAMDAYRRLLDNNFVFPHCETAEKIVTAHSKADRKSDPLDEFVRFDCVLSPEYTANNENLYRVYLTRCGTTRTIPLSGKQFIAELRKKYSLDGGRGKRDPEGKRAHITRGIALRAVLDSQEESDVFDLPQ